MSGLGHLGLGFAAKKAAPMTKLVILLAATEMLDILWGIFWLAGIKSSAWTHGLFMALIWSIIAALLTGLVTRKSNTGFVIGLLVFSHWLVDFITHPMGFILPGDTGVPLLFEGSPIVGLGLYNTLGGVILGEALLILPGLFIYAAYINKQRKNRSSLVKLNSN